MLWVEQKEGKKVILSPAGQGCPKLFHHVASCSTCEVKCSHGDNCMRLACLMLRNTVCRSRMEKRDEYSRHLDSIPKEHLTDTQVSNQDTMWLTILMFFVR